MHNAALPYHASSRAYSKNNTCAACTNKIDLVVEYLYYSKVDGNVRQAKLIPVHLQDDD